MLEVVGERSDVEISILMPLLALTALLIELPGSLEAGLVGLVGLGALAMTQTVLPVSFVEVSVVVGLLALALKVAVNETT